MTRVTSSHDEVRSARSPGLGVAPRPFLRLENRDADRFAVFHAVFEHWVGDRDRLCTNLVGKMLHRVGEALTLRFAQPAPAGRLAGYAPNPDIRLIEVN